MLLLILFCLLSCHPPEDKANTEEWIVVPVATSGIYDVQITFSLSEDASLYYFLSPELIDSIQSDSIIYLVKNEKLDAEHFWGVFVTGAGRNDTIRISDLKEDFTYWLYLAVEDKDGRTLDHLVFMQECITHPFRRIEGDLLSTHYKYWQFLPEDYYHYSEKRFPILLQLHGAGQKGQAIEGDPNSIYLDFLLNGYQCIVINPHTDLNWIPWKLDQLFEYLENQLRVDPNHVYLTGFSMGGFGTWDYAKLYGKRLAAIIPVAGGTDRTTNSYPGQLMNLPIWAFHNNGDKIVPSSNTKEIVADLIAAGSNPEPKMTIIDSDDHDVLEAWVNSTYDWMFEQKKK